MAVERKAPCGFIGNVGAGRPDLDTTWQTPPELLWPLRRYWGGRIPFDVATAPENPTGAAAFWTAGDDALTRVWPDRFFLNPPYGKALRTWLMRAAAETSRGIEGIVLVSAARWEQGWFQDVLATVSHVCFVRGRVAFIRAATGERVGGNTYANMYLAWNPRDPDRWLSAFRAVGACVEWRGLSGSPGATASRRWKDSRRPDLFS